MPVTPTWEDTTEDVAPTWEETFDESQAIIPEPAELFINPEARFIRPGASTIAGGPQLRTPGDFSLGPQVMEGIRGIPSAAAELTTKLVEPVAEQFGREPEESLVGLSPQRIPSGQAMSEATGIPAGLTVPFSAGTRALAGLGQFLTSPVGIADIGVAAIPGIGLLQRAKFIKDMAEGAGETAGRLSVLVEEAAKQPEPVTTDQAQAMADETANTLLMLYGAGKLTSHQVSQLTGIRAPLGRVLESEKTRLAKDMAEQLKRSEPLPEAAPTPTPIRQLGIPAPTLTAEPFLQPGVPELAGAALREAQGPRIEIPGQLSALETLRREIEPPRIALEPPPQFAIRPEPPRGETAVARTFEGVRVEPSVLRSASDILLEKASKKEASPDIITRLESLKITETGEGRTFSLPHPDAIKAIGVSTWNSAIDVAILAVRAGKALAQAVDEAVKYLRRQGKQFDEKQIRSNLEYEIKGGEKDAIQQTPETVLRDVQQPQVAQEGKVALPADAGRPKAGETLTEPALGKFEAATLEGVVPIAGFGRTMGSAEATGRDVSIENPSWKPNMASGKQTKAVVKVKGGWLEGWVRPDGKFVTSDNIPIPTWAEAQAALRASREISQRPATTIPPTESEAVAMRKSAERATTSPMVPEPVQERIATAPESFYRVQSMKRVEEAVTSLSDMQLSAVPRDSNLYTASRLEQAKRLFDRGENDAGYRVFEELEKEGTLMGQLINQFKLLKGSRPEMIVRVINSKLAKSGKDPLTEKQGAQAIDLAAKSKEKDVALDKATDQWAKDPTGQNAEAAEKALLESNLAALELQRFTSRFSPRSTSAILKSVLQGNLLTPISEVYNIFGNISFLPFRSADRAIATAIDILDSAITKRPRELTVQPLAGTAEAVKGIARGVSQIPEIFRRGTGETIKGETRAGLHPVRAWINQFARQPEIPTTQGRITLQDRLNLAIEGTFGVPAEMMLRGLGAGDVGFKEAARSRITAAELRLAGVPRNQWSFAQKFPELFLSRKALENIHADTMAAVFQRQSATLNLLTGWIRRKGDLFDLAVATVAPYKVTPWNIVGEILSYNPLIAFARTVYEAKSKQGTSRAAKLNAGKFFVGSAITAAGWWLYSKGLITPSMDERDEAQKARILAGEVIPPNHINISGLKRAMTGGDPTFKPGDETVDVFRSGGLAGSIFYMTANVGRDMESKPEVSEGELWASILKQSSLEQARFGLNQSFLAGVEGLLTAVKDGNSDNYLRQWASTVASIPMPNSMTALSRATRKFKPDFRADTTPKQIENVFRNRLGFAGLDDYLPLKRGLWGEPLPETPKDRNALLYHFFDISKNRQVTDDPVPLELFPLWRKTADAKVFPPLPGKTITVGRQTYALTAGQQSRYAELVGTERRRIVDAVMVNPEFHQLSDEAKIQLLDRIYRAGLDAGKVKFWGEVGPALELKPARAGFEPE